MVEASTDDRLKRIKFLVEQSKLYAEFLKSSIEPVKPEPKDIEQDNAQHVDLDNENVAIKEDCGDENTDLVKREEPAPSKRRRLNRKSMKPVHDPQQTSITAFCKPKLEVNKEVTTEDPYKPHNLKATLFPHQRIALKWLVMLYENGLNGILADEMGLGKTLEVIAFLVFLQQNGTNGPFLILCPLSVVGNWCTELQKFAPTLEYMKYHGSPSERASMRKRGNKAWSNIVITSYEMALNDAKFLKKHEWKFIIVDEGHRLKNIDSKLMKTLKQFPSTNRMLLTGTPLQNNLPELWSLLNFLMPDIFVDLNIFQTWFETGEIKFEEAEEENLVTSLHDILRPFLLRRLKKDVGLQLPPKREYIMFTPLSPLQQRLYKAFLSFDPRSFVQERIREDLNLKDESGSDHDPNPALEKRDRKELRERNHMRIEKSTFANLVMQLRLVCDSPYIYWDPFIDEVDERLETNSGKLVLLNRIMSKLAPQGHKVLIFTQFSEMLFLLKDWADFRKYKYVAIHGDVCQKDRQENIDAFNRKDSDIDLFLLTTRSGGQGVNLISADTVVIFDSDWNPQQDLQAMDRVHRIGQQKPVIVIRLCTPRSIEQDLLDRAAQKLRLNEVVIESGGFQGLEKGTKQQKIDRLNSQIEIGHLEFSKNAKITDADLDNILDRSLEAYKECKPQSKITDSIYCVSSIY